MDEQMKKAELELKLLLNRKVYEQGLINHELYLLVGESLLKEYGIERDICK